MGLTAETQELLRQRMGFRCGKPLETTPCFSGDEPRD